MVGTNQKKYVAIPIILLCLFLVLIPGCRVQQDSNDNGNQNGDGNHDDNSNGDTIEKMELWTNGTRLRGANIYQRRVYPELDGDQFMGSDIIGPPYTQQDFHNLAALGANYVNISHPGIFTEKSPFQLDQAVLDHLKNLLSKIEEADMFAVVSFRTGPGRSEFTFFWGEDEDWFDASYYNDQVWRVAAIQQAWRTMWRRAAQEFKDSPIVVGYDLMVEPNSNDVWHDIWDPDDFYNKYAGSLYDWNIMFPPIIDAIREVDSHTPVLVGGLAYSAVAWLPYVQPAADERTVYTIHQYEPFVYTHQDPNGANNYPGTFDADWDGIPDVVNKQWLDRLLEDVDGFKSTHGATVACNEFGVVRWVPGAATFMNDLMTLFEDRGLNHALWVWDPSWPHWTTEVNAFNFRFGPNPNTTTDLNASPLLDTIKTFWSQNTHRPSTVTF